MPTYIDPHIHMISRVTEDYHRMALSGCAAISEPAFWAGFDRGSVDGFRDYFRHLTEVEPKRAAQFGIRHYSWLCINAKEAENVELSRGVIQMIPEYLNKPNVLGIGEIGLNKNTRNEAIVFQEHVDLAMKTNELILIHTPHLEDKYKGTRMIIDMLKNDRRVDPERVLIDHVEEHTVRHALDNEMHTATRVRHHRDGRHRAHHGQLRGRLGQVRSTRGAGVDARNEAARPCRERHPQARVREPAGVLAAIGTLAGMAH